MGVTEGVNCCIGGTDAVGGGGGDTDVGTASMIPRAAEPPYEFPDDGLMEMSAP